MMTKRILFWCSQIIMQAEGSFTQFLLYWHAIHFTTFAPAKDYFRWVRASLPVSRCETLYIHRTTTGNIFLCKLRKCFLNQRGSSSINTRIMMRAFFLARYVMFTYLVEKTVILKASSALPPNFHLTWRV